MSISVSAITKIYGQQKAVDNVSFSIPENGITGFLGPNGAGKSTTMKIITGYLTPDSGTALVNGIDVSKDPIAAKKRIGYLPEGNPLYPDMYVREYLQFIAEVHGLQNIRQRIEEVLSLTGLTPESNKKNGQLSKGFKQRVGLAAALIHDPEVLILDEPTTGLDPNQIIEIRQVIKNLGKNKTVLFSSHILQEVESVCDRVIIISHGAIVADDTLAHLQSANKNAHIISARFSHPVEIPLLKAMPHVDSVSQQDNEYFLNTSEPEKLKKLLLAFSLENNADLLSLQTKSLSLEEVFRNYTA